MNPDHILPDEPYFSTRVTPDGDLRLSLVNGSIEDNSRGDTSFSVDLDRRAIIALIYDLADCLRQIEGIDTEPTNDAA